MLQSKRIISHIVLFRKKEEYAFTYLSNLMCFRRYRLKVHLVYLLLADAADNKEPLRQNDFLGKGLAGCRQLRVSGFHLQTIDREKQYELENSWLVFSCH